MQIVRSLERDDAAMVGWGVRTLLLSCEGENGPLQRRLASLGSKVDLAEELFSALSEVIDDPMGYALLMIDCDCPGVGGLEAAQRAVQMMGQTGARVPVILVSSECKTQTFPTDRMAPTVLRAPTSAVSLKVGFEHALRERLFFQAA